MIRKQNYGFHTWLFSQFSCKAVFCHLLARPERSQTATASQSAIVAACTSSVWQSFYDFENMCVSVLLAQSAFPLYFQKIPCKFGKVGQTVLGGLVAI